MFCFYSAFRVSPTQAHKAMTFHAMFVKLYGRHLLMKLNYNATHFECFSSIFIMQLAFFPFLDRSSRVMMVADTTRNTLTKAHGQRMSHHGDLFNVGHGSENGKRQPHKKKLCSC